jgi:hypothetical protein
MSSFKIWNFFENFYFFPEKYLHFPLAIKIVGISIIACSSEIGVRETSKDNTLGVFRKILAVLGII